MTDYNVVLESKQIGYLAYGYFDGNRITVLQGSTISPHRDSKLGLQETNAREEVFATGATTCTRDYVFSTPSSAGNFVTGRSTNGWIAWKDIYGNFLKEYRNNCKLPESRNYKGNVSRASSPMQDEREVLSNHQRNEPWTRDEVILALDVIWSSIEENRPISKMDVEVLSQYLNQLPAIPFTQRKDSFRNKAGVQRHLVQFREAILSGKSSKSYGTLFYVLNDEYANKKNELHLIANAIKKNISVVENITFASKEEEVDFCEGALLEHLHRYIEQRDKPAEEMPNSCSICRIDLRDIYQGAVDLECHLTTSPGKLDGSKKYAKGDFIWVCPNCHKALHRIRPWLSHPTEYELLK